MFEQCQMRRRKWYVGMIGILLALVVKIPDLWADVDEMAQLLVERLPEHATERYHHPDISPNGDKVAFSVSTDSRNKSVIWVYDIPSGEMLQLTDPDTTMDRGDVHVQWSPDGETIAFVSDRSGENHIYLVPSTGGELERLTSQSLRDSDWPWACRFSWSPDGERIAFSDNDDNEGVDLFTIRLNDGAIEQLTEHVGIEQHPGWSPDGRSIVYVSNQSGLEEFVVHELATGAERRVPMDALSDISYPVWSPDGEWIAFVARDTEGLASFIVSVKGGGAQKVGPGRNFANWGPAWDPDGDHLFFHTEERIDTPLIVRDMVSGREEQLLDSINPLGVIWASWSLDSRYLAFPQITETAAGVLDTAIYIAGTETEKPRRLGKTVVVSGFFKRQAPAWTADPKNLIAVVPQGDYTQLALIDVQKEEQQVLTATPTFKTEVAVSPDGELMVYVVRAGDKEDLWIYDRITDEELQLTFSGDEKMEPVFSPDGNTIAFVGVREKHIFTIPADGGEVMQHTDDSGWNFDPRWIDERSLYYSGGTKPRSVQRINLYPSKRDVLYAVEGVNIFFPFLSRDRRQLFYVSKWKGDLHVVDLDTGLENIVVKGGSRSRFSPDGSKLAYVKEEQVYSTIWRYNIEQIIEKIELP